MSVGLCEISAHVAFREVVMERFIHRQNLELYRKLLAESNAAQLKDGARHRLLLKLLVDEEASAIRFSGRDG